MIARHVYFIKPVGDDGPIKIGCSIDPVKRLRQFQWSCQMRFEIMASARGGLDIEQALHRRFSHYQTTASFAKPNCGTSEWFSPAAEIIEYAERVRAAGRHFVDDCEIRHREVARLRRDGKTFREIAEIVGVSIGGASALFQSAMWHEQMSARLAAKQAAA